jgi:hypothetical protein
MRDDLPIRIDKPWGQTPHLDDVVRLVDSYGREGTSAS